MIVPQSASETTMKLLALLKSCVPVMAVVVSIASTGCSQSADSTATSSRSQNEGKSSPISDHSLALDHSIIAVESHRDLVNRENNRVRVIGVASNPSKGWPIVTLRDASMVPVVIDKGRWPAEVERKSICVHGSVTRVQFKYNEEGAAVNENSDIIQTYAGPGPVYFLTNCSWHAD